ncbi:MAG: B12-binding domain-containing radical SAM protein [Dethiobacteria bacterium]|jgi:radical SAM superfamily enzyme YgiQ (UPF0313 family)
MKILLVYPQYSESFWSFKYALKFIGLKAALPPLGLLSIAALLPQEWEKKLVDMNVRKLKDADLKWADYVMISAMSIQQHSVREVIARCKELGVRTIAGGPLFTAEPEKFDAVDHLILNEGELTLPVFLEDLEKGCPQHIYTTAERPSLEKTPVPLWKLINLRDYATMSVQFSRGCPYDCEFCDITALFGRRPRLKTAAQVIKELEALYEHGWRGGVFVVDDNFIGNKVHLKQEILPAMINWMKERKNPFWYITEASINLADDEELMLLMQQAGFISVFIGIETPSEESLKECNKFHNVNRDMIACVKKIQNFGMQVTGGFIVGFDSDTPSIFERQINFIQKSGIVTAMVGMLQAPVGTKLFQRLKREKRLLPDRDFSGNNTELAVNFIPKMNIQKLTEGYQKIVTTIYDPQHYYARVQEFFKEFKPTYKRSISTLRLCYAKALFHSMFTLGIREKGRRYYWKLLFQTLVKYPRFLPEAVTFAIYGHHFRKFFNVNRCLLQNEQ